MSSTWRKRLFLGLAAVVTAAGAVITSVALARPVSFGWFAYAPLSDTAFAPEGVHLVSTTAIVGAVVLAVGLMALAFWAGLAIGAHRRHAPAVATAVTDGGDTFP